ncbi:MAG TPA: class I SAM-dependent methyltransferase [Myxococcota bacterium]|nr:class I SAM-dependent methyltransferase [Myxococcota bacterium]
MSQQPLSDRAFDSHAGDYESQLREGLRLSGESKEFYARGRLTHLRERWQAMARPEPTRIIDYGCGVGDVTALIAEMFSGAEVLGLDPSPRCIERARSEYTAPRISFATLEGFGSTIAGTADLIHMNGVVHHVPSNQRPQLFAAVAALVAPEGMAAVFENNPWNPGTRMVMARIPFDRGTRSVGPQEIRRRLRSASLKPIETGYLFYFPRPLRFFRPLEPLLLRVPLGAQYSVLASR